MVVNPDGRLCACGNLGCWESEVGLTAFLELAAEADDPLRDAAVERDAQVVAVMDRATGGDLRALQAVQHVARYLGLGLAGLINIFNPDTVVLGGYFTRLFPLVIEPVQRIVHERVLSERLTGCRIVPSSLDMYAGAVGAAIASVDRIVADPTGIPMTTEARLSPTS